MKNDTWQLQDAKSKFSQVVDNAMHNKPQFVTKHGKPVAPNLLDRKFTVSQPDRYYVGDITYTHYTSRC